MFVTTNARTGVASVAGSPSATRPSGAPDAVATPVSATITSMTAHPEQPVAVFDSGVGGLTVLHELLVSLPSEDYLYLGDTVHFPYGARSAEELRAVRDRDRRSPGRRRGEADRRGLQLGQRGRARRDRAPHGRVRARDRRDRRPAAGGPARGRGQPHRPDRPAGDSGDRGQRRLRAGRRRRRPARAPGERRLSGPRADHPGRVPVRRAGRGDRARVLRAVAGS